MKYNPKVERFGKAKNEMVRGQNKFLNEWIQESVCKEKYLTLLKTFQ
jgi:hypothetical protein